LRRYWIRVSAASLDFVSDGTVQGRRRAWRRGVIGLNILMNEADRVDGSAPAPAPEWVGLQDLLARPDRGAVSWQDTTARLVSLAHVFTLGSTSDDLEYLRALALVKWAQSAGVREAKKKTVTPTRFRSKEPPELERLEHPHIRSFALEALSSIRTGWCAGYISRALRLEDWERQTVSLLIRWALRNCATASSLTSTVLGALGEVRRSAKYQQLVIKELTSAIPKLSWDTTEAASRDVGAFLESVGGLFQAAAGEAPNRAALWALIAVLDRHAREAHPLLITEPSFVLGVVALRGQLEGAGQGKPLDSFLLRLALSTLSCSAYLMERAGRGEVARLQALLPAFKEAYPGFADRLAEHRIRNPVLGELIDLTVGVASAGLEDQASSVYARLLPAWHEFIQAHPDAPAVASLSATILEAAAANGVEFLGAAGDVCAFDPIVHRLQDTSNPARPQKVTLVRPAIVYRRSSGSYRVVVQALASACDRP
jgi:hypothetical protein